MREASVEVVMKTIEGTSVDDLLEPQGIIIGLPT